MVTFHRDVAMPDIERRFAEQDAKLHSRFDELLSHMDGIFDGFEHQLAVRQEVDELKARVADLQQRASALESAASGRRQSG